MSIRRTYAIGDVHGRLDLLLQLLLAIGEDAGRANLRLRELRLVFLGDYVDRGPASREVIATLDLLQRKDVMKVVTLRGNHDQYLLDFLNDSSDGPVWARLGGSATLRSYGVATPRDRSDLESWRVASQQLAQAMRPKDVAFLERTQLTFQDGPWLFVHAGVRPGVALQEQTAQDLLTIRGDFGSHPHPLPGLTVVHGHTPVAKAEWRDGRAPVDTGAYATGVLTAARIEGTELSFLSIGDREGR